MEREKFHIEKNTIQETLIIPLYARKLCTEIFPEIYSDQASIELMKKLDYDFSKLEKQSDSILQKFGALEIAMRQMDLAIEIEDYLKGHPKAAVVNMGCGLDQTGEVCDNGSCKIYNIDMPDVIAIRTQLIPSTERITNIACNLNDFSWFEKIDASNGVVFFAAGVFYYLNTLHVQHLINQMAKRFPDGKLVFDTSGKKALKLMLKTWVKQAGIQNISAFFHVDCIEKDVQPWIKNAQVSYKGYMMGYTNLKELHISTFFRFLSRLSDHVLKMKIIRFDFTKPDHGI